MLPKNFFCIYFPILADCFLIMSPPLDVFGSERVYCNSSPGSRQAGRNCCLQFTEGRGTVRTELALKPSNLTCQCAELSPAFVYPRRGLSRCSFLGVLEVFELPSHSPQRIFTKGGGGGAVGSHLWTCLGVGSDYSGNPSSFEGGDFNL